MRPQNIHRVIFLQVIKSFTWYVKSFLFEAQKYMQTLGFCKSEENVFHNIIISRASSRLLQIILCKHFGSWIKYVKADSTVK